MLEIEMEERSVLAPIKFNGLKYYKSDVTQAITTASGSGNSQDQFIIEEPKIMQIDSYSPSSACNAKVLDSDDMMHTAPCVKASAYVENNLLKEPCILGYTRDDKGNVQNYHEREIAGTLHTSSGQGGNTDQFIKETLYRIRKLTPTECLRLMGVDDTNIEKMKSAKLMQTLKNGKVKEKPMPKTQLYKMAGNSIVVDVLYHIFYQMFIAEPPKPKVKQLSLFDL